MALSSRFERVDRINASYGRVVALSQITPGDLDVAIIGQLPPSQLPFDSKLEAGSREMERFQATLRGRRLIEQSLERALRYTHETLVLPEDNGELDRLLLRIPASVFGQGEKDHCKEKLVR